MPRRAGQPPLTRDRIVAAALELIDGEGLDALSMRRLGAQLGVDAMAIYQYLPNKEALIHAVVREVFAAMTVPRSRGTWQTQVRVWARAYRSIAEDHPNLVLRIVSDPAAVAVAAILANETLYAALESSGLAPRDVSRAADLVVDYVNGFVLSAAAAAGSDADAAFQAELDSQPRGSVATQRRIFDDPRIQHGRDSFTFGLDVILAGLVSRIRS